LDKLLLFSGDSVNLIELRLERANESVILVPDLESKYSSLLRIIGVEKSQVRGYTLNPSNDKEIEK